MGPQRGSLSSACTTGITIRISAVDEITPPTHGCRQRRAQVGAPREIKVDRESVPISVIVRTKDRPALLREAIDSIRATGYPADIVVVNDGGAKPDVLGATLINHDRSKGRSEAMNSGVRAAKSPLLAFLDDDDLYYPEHHATLANAAASSTHAAWYSDAVSAFVRIGASGAYDTHSRMRIFGSDFDRDQLLIDNYIPLPTLLVPRATYQEIGGFDPGMRAYGMEDLELSVHMWTAGRSCLLVPEVSVEHLYRTGAATPAYQTNWEAGLANVLRFGVVHFGSRRLARLLDVYRGDGVFSAAMAAVAHGDADARRRWVAGHRLHDDDWYFARCNGEATCEPAAVRVYDAAAR